MSLTNKLESIISPNRDYTPRTNTHTLKEFLESTIYQDFLSEVAVRIESMRDFNEECNSKEYLETRGGIKALRLTAGIFTDLYENSKSDNLKEENENGS